MCDPFFSRSIFNLGFSLFLLKQRISTRAKGWIEWARQMTAVEDGSNNLMVSITETIAGIFRPGPSFGHFRS